MNRRHLLWAVAVAICIAAYLFVSPSDEKLIKRSLNNLIEHASKKEEEHPLEQITLADKISKLFTDPATIAVYQHDKEAEVSTYDQSALSARIVGLRSKVGRIEITIGSVKIETRDNTAVVELNVRGEGSAIGERETRYEEVSLRLKYTKQSGVWKIAEAQNVLSSEGAG